MEIKTCEEYVLNELLNTQSKLEKLENENKELASKLDALLKEREIIKESLSKHSTINTASSIGNYINFSAIWSDSKDYGIVVNYLDLVEPEEENKE